MYEHLPFTGKVIYEQARFIGRPKPQGFGDNDLQGYLDVRMGFRALYVDEPQWLILTATGQNIDIDHLSILKIDPMEAVHKAIEVYTTVVLPEAVRRVQPLTVRDEKSRKNPVELSREWQSHLGAMEVRL